MPTYLCIDCDGGFIRNDVPRYYPEIYLMTPEWEALHRQWYDAPSCHDGLSAGVYADWLEENGDGLQRISGDGSCLAKMIEFFRERFTNPAFNKVAVSS